MTLGIVGVRRDMSSLQAGRAVVAGLWAEKSAIKGSCEQKPGLAEGFSPSALLRLGPWAAVRHAFSSVQDTPSLHPSCLSSWEESPQMASA